MAKSIWPIAGMAAVIGVVTSIALGASTNGQSKPVPTVEAPKPADTRPLVPVNATDSPTPSDGASWDTPASASVADRATMRVWFASQEDCRGSYADPKTNPACARFSDASEKLARRGWCFDYPDKPASEGAWHRCSADVREPERPQVSARYARWWARAEQMALMAARDDAMTYCGMKGFSSVNLGAAFFNDLHYEPPYGLIYGNMTKAEREKADVSYISLVNSEGKRLASDCAALKKAEWGDL